MAGALIIPIPKTPTRFKTKLISNFGTELDDVVHENTVKSISSDIMKLFVKTEKAVVKDAYLNEPIRI